MPNIITQNIIPIAMVAYIAFAVTRAARRKQPRSHISLPNTSVLLTQYTDGTQLLPVGTGEVSGRPYSAITTTDLKMLLIRVELEFTSQLHLLGVPKNTKATQIDPATTKGVMEPVKLEGDYNNYFDLYCEAGQQIQSRYILDPKAMLFTVDFCRSHNWEIIDNVLLFLQTSSNNPNDPTDMFDDIEGFISTIKPALAIPPSQLDLKNSTPYGVDRRPSLNCPLCHAAMSNTHGYFLCPNNDGLSCNAANLYQIRTGKLKVPDIENPKQPDGARSNLVCPSCQSTMVKVPYNGGIFTMDTCPHCNYRWLDAAEIPRLVTEN